MSKVFAEIVSLDAIEPHPYADRLEVAKIRGTTVVVPKEQYTAGELVVYFPPDILLPDNVAETLGVTKYLKTATYPGELEKSQCRVSAARLRGIPSFGFIAPCNGHPPEVGLDVSSHYGAVKYEPPVNLSQGDQLPDIASFHEYTSIEHYWRYPDVFTEGEEVVITEKIHGSNVRLGVRMVDGQPELLAGSHRLRRVNGLYWKPFEMYPIAEMLASLVGDTNRIAIVFGELFGPGIQDMDYGLPDGTIGFRAFDISVDGRYLDYDQYAQACNQFAVPMVPTLFAGRWTPEVLAEYVDGPTRFTIPRCEFKGREGIVIRSRKESFYAPTNGRKVVKAVSVDYLARKGGQDNE